jgi:hypothetical protein
MKYSIENILLEIHIQGVTFLIINIKNNSENYQKLTKTGEK